jgi:hypothetical protein
LAEARLWIETAVRKCAERNCSGRDQAIAELRQELAEARAKTEHFIKLYEFYLDLSETGKRELSEARAALRENPIEVGKPMYAIDAMEWLDKHAAAIKAAREGMP